MSGPTLSCAAHNARRRGNPANFLQARFWTAPPLTARITSRLPTTRPERSRAPGAALGLAGSALYTAHAGKPGPLKLQGGTLVRDENPYLR
jgi:hypothetical protein